ncbi:DNA-3-methyladenine glycosylase I [Rhodovulum sp. DZ06]|uniref:DNA-3-methyladenine glycosylase I n=1 Tax=Rhodovulum sp. DZ06 TaxID=3425126 RepID=UPI003D347F7A
MRRFEEIFAIAADRHGGPAAVEALLPVPKPAAALRAIPADRWLACMTRCVFQAGFSWSVIDAKWPGFEAAFHGFDIDWCAGMGEAELDALLCDSRIVRNGAKIGAVQANAALLQALEAQGGAGAVFADWPAADYAGLLAMLKTRGGRLGGLAGARAMREMGRDGWVLSPDVTARLAAEGVIAGPPTSKKAQAAVQAAFDGWAAETGRPFAAISRVLALSIDG